MIKKLNAQAFGDGSSVVTNPMFYRRRLERECREDLSQLIGERNRKDAKTTETELQRNSKKPDRNVAVLCGTILGFSVAFSAYLRSEHFITIISAYLVTFFVGRAIFAAVWQRFYGRRSTNAKDCQ